MPRDLEAWLAVRAVKGLDAAFRFRTRLAKHWGYACQFPKELAALGQSGRPRRGGAKVDAL